MKASKHLILFFLVVCLSGCEPSQSEKLFTRAQDMEQQPGGQSYPTVEAYREVIKADPNSKWAEKAQHRIDVLQQLFSSWNAESAARIQNLQNIMR
jgi:hypothetical protein